VVFFGIFIAYVFGITNAVFWIASRKNTQKPVNIIMPNNPSMVLLELTVLMSLTVFF
jgi:hypothetical protein